MIAGLFDPTRGMTLLAPEGPGTPGASRQHDGNRTAVCSGAVRFTDGEAAAIARDQGDAAAWLHLAQRHGADAPRHASGRFAVAVFDGDARSGFLAVDRFAIESLCFASGTQGVAFASRADDVPGTAFELDPQALFDYLHFHMIPAPRTVFRGVQRLLPGHRLVLDDRGARMERWWEPRFAETGERASFEDLRDAFRARLREAVARTLDHGSVGCFLSGGTDSSTVAGLIGEVSGQPARTYSIGFDAAGYDEMAYARIAARHFGTDHHEHYVTPADLVETIPLLAREFDQPFGNSSVAPAFCCARMARADGIDMLLAGDGGDELFGGNTRYATQQLLEAYQRVPTALRRGVIEPIASLRWASALPVVRKGASYVEQARTPMPDRMHRYNLLQRIGIDTLLEPDFVAQVDRDAPARQQREVYDASTATALINRMLAYDWKYTLADSDLPKVLGATHAAGVATAFPLLDDDLVDFSLALPPELKLRGRQLRWFFKEALRGFLPDEIITKKKHGFGLPFGVWVAQPGALRDLALDALDGVSRRGIVRRDFVQDLVGRLLPEHPGYYGEMVWILMMMERWLAGHEAARPSSLERRAAMIVAAPHADWASGTAG
jgi:asparagine synthase (glutamine-hydrolysing)